MLQRRSIKRSRTEDNLALLDASARGRVPFGAQHRRNSQLSITAVHYSDEAEESDGIGYDSDTQLGTRRRKSGEDWPRRRWLGVLPSSALWHPQHTHGLFEDALVQSVLRSRETCCDLGAVSAWPLWLTAVRPPQVAYAHQRATTASRDSQSCRCATSCSPSDTPEQQLSRHSCLDFARLGGPIDPDAEPTRGAQSLGPNDRRLSRR